MPIHINLLAESQALEELRRRDPVKRAVWIGVLLVIAMLGWSSFLQIKTMGAKRDLSRLEADLAKRTNGFQAVLQNKKKLQDVNRKLTALQQLATNRFLNGSVLNALQLTTVEDVQLV